MILKDQITQIDPQTGQEVTTFKRYRTRVKTQETFFTTFIGSLQGFYNLTSLTDVKVLTRFCEIAEVNSNTVYLPSGRRKEVCEDLRISSSQLSNSLKNLKDRGLILGSHGVYKLNPVLYWKGSFEARENMLAKGLRFELQIDLSTGEIVEDEDVGVKLTFFEPQK